MLPQDNSHLIRATKKPLTYILIRKYIVESYQHTKLKLINNEKYRFQSKNQKKNPLEVVYLILKKRLWFVLNLTKVCHHVDSQSMDKTLEVLHQK